jgi:hypothetical protein
MNINKYKEVLYKISKLNLFDKQSIIDCICEFGLAYDRRPLYDNYFSCMNLPNELGLWQRPEQLSECILYLLNHCDINSFLEIGTYKASTFLVLREFLLSKNPNLFSKTIDPVCLLDTKMLNEFNINYQQTDVSNINESYDLVFIDGNHSYRNIKLDFEYCIKHNTKYILLHDIVDKHCPDVVKFWGEIKSKYKTKEFTDCEDKMGFGLVVLSSVLFL